MSKRIKRKSDEYYQTTVKAYRADGSIYRKNISAKTLTELNRKIAQARQDFDSGKVTSDMTYAQLAEKFFNEYTNKMSDKRRYLQRKRYESKIMPIIGHMKICAIKHEHASQLLNHILEAGLAKDTVKSYMCLARRILKVAIKDSIVLQNPFDDIEIPTGLPEEERRPLTDFEIDLVMRSWKKHRMGIPAMILLFTGIRRGELLALDYKDILLEQEVIDIKKAVSFEQDGSRIKSPKTKSSIRLVAIPKLLKAIIEAIPLEQRKGLVCPSSKGELMTASAFRHAWRSYWNMLNVEAGGIKAIGRRRKVVVIDNITPHMFRHTYTSMLYEASVDIKSAKELLGHSNEIVTLKTYTHLSKRKKAASIDALNSMLDETYNPNTEEKDEQKRLFAATNNLDCFPNNPIHTN